MKTVLDIVFYFNPSDRWTAADLGDGGIGVFFNPSLPTSLSFSLALHNHSPVRCHSVVRVTAGWMSCFRLTFKPRERDTSNQI